MNTDISVLLDRSGSMEQIRTDTIGGFNAFLSEQQKLSGEATLTLVQFDSQGYDRVVDASPLASAKPLTSETFQPRAATPLFDSMGRLITETGERLKAIQEATRPSNVVIVVITDGYENASREFTADRIRGMVQHQTNAYKWQFIYLGANHDAILAAKTLGFDASSAAAYDVANVSNTYRSLGAVMSNARSGQKAAFTSAQRALMTSKK